MTKRTRQGDGGDTLIQARPTMYRGTKMRSRLEADFAERFLDRHNPGEWLYEPMCFAGQGGQYLPDFVVNGVYIEVKPPVSAPCQGMPHDRGIDTSDVDAWLQRMEIIWESDSGAPLYLALWPYGGPQTGAFCAAGDDHVWWWFRDGEWSLWPGRGQFEAVKRSRGRAE